ncbi:hypothetical protein [Flavivirga eckloniae]|nr:hypothetical protein [Flavivirga eckloniae]
MKKAIVFLVLIINSFHFSCKSAKNNFNSLSGDFINSKDNLKLTLINNNYFLQNISSESDIANYKCCDTISYGYYSFDTKTRFVTLNSSRDFDVNDLNFNVKESINKNQDSLVFKFLNPIENHYIKFKEKSREINYSIQILGSKPLYISSDKNPLVVNNIERIDEVQFFIRPKNDIPLKNLGMNELVTQSYRLVNPNSNQFDIDFPGLDYEFINFKRLNHEYIKVVNENLLIWDGIEYYKKNKTL